MLTKIIKSLYTPWNLLILIILLLAFILRIYRIEALLDFHYDQGRDAKIIWDLWHSGKFFLIGPTTGLEGIFLGPFYYYLIAPFYLIGGGNPTIPSMFLSLLTTIALYILYLTGTEIQGKFTGLVALIIASFSNSIIFSSRWLSNPTPIFLTSISIFYLMILIIKSNKFRYWFLIYLLVGLSLQFELASAIFYLPILLVFTIWQFKKINVKIFAICCAIILVTLLPQIIFNFKHQNILVNNAVYELKFGKSVQINYINRVKTIWKITSEIF
jgi:4-amino-4-deoxy-L-arabinose transferase-like glycosyltransferase